MNFKSLVQRYDIDASKAINIVSNNNKNRSLQQKCT